MLYDFHKYQNAIRADSVHATYLVYGTKRQEYTSPGEDVEMTGSVPEHESLSEEAPSFTMTLARQEELHGNFGSLFTDITCANSEV